MFGCKWHHCTTLQAINYSPGLLYTQKTLNSILAFVQFFKIPVSVVHLQDNSKNKSTSNSKDLKNFDSNGIIVHPYKLLTTVY